MDRHIKVADDGELVEEEYVNDSMGMASGKAKEAEHSSLEDDLVNNPSHYQSMVKGLNIEAIDCMRAAFGDDNVKAFCLCNSLKYVFRSSSKGQDEDINKAIWYLNKFLELGGYKI